MSKEIKMQQPITFPGALEILFIGLKLSHIIAWSWWFVFSPVLVLCVISAVIASGKKAAE